MLRKLMLIAAALLSLALAHSYSSLPAEAVPLRLDAAATHADTGAIFVRHRWRSWQRPQQETSVAVFIIPGLYWGPAWWDPAYSRLCWKKARICRDCEKNWVFVC
jgi:hypothetical protein